MKWFRLNVRDSECDMQGIVNNAIYQNYCEHARHAVLKESGATFDEMVKDELYMVVRKAEIDYLQPLRSGDSALINMRVSAQSRLKWWIHQEIYRVEPNTSFAELPVEEVLSDLPDAPARASLCLSAQFMSVPMSPTGRPCRLPEKWESIFLQMD